MKFSEELVNCLTAFILKGFPLSATEIREIVWDYADENEIEGFSQTNTAAGWTWWRKFCERYPQFVTKNPINLSVARAMGGNPQEIGKWFKVYRGLLSELGIEDKPGQIWNIDEKGLHDVPKTTKCVGLVGKDLVQLVSGERGVGSTVVSFVSADGEQVEPMIIHKGMKVGKGWEQ